MAYRLMRVRVRNKMFQDLEDHALKRTAELDRRIYISDIVRYACREYLADRAKQEEFEASIRDASSRDRVVPAQHVDIASSVHAESGLHT